MKLKSESDSNVASVMGVSDGSGVREGIGDAEAAPSGVSCRVGVGVAGFCIGVCVATGANNVAGELIRSKKIPTTASSRKSTAASKNKTIFRFDIFRITFLKALYPVYCSDTNGIAAKEREQYMNKTDAYETMQNMGAPVAAYLAGSFSLGK